MSSSELQRTHPPHPASLFGMSSSQKDPHDENSLPCSRISDVECYARRQRRGELAAGREQKRLLTKQATY